MKKGRPAAAFLAPTWASRPRARATVRWRLAGGELVLFLLGSNTRSHNHSFSILDSWNMLDPDFNFVLFNNPNFD